MCKRKYKKINSFPWLVLSASLCFLFAVQSSFAQKPPVVFKNYSVQDGLSHSYVTTIIQDSEDLIWIATEDGLNKFNGYTFEVYRADPKDKSTLSSSNVTALAEDDKHDLWVGTWGGGVCTYDRKLSRFRRLAHDKAEDASLHTQMNFVYSLYKDTEGNIWVCTSEGLMKVNPDTYEIVYFRHEESDLNSISHNRVHAITQDKEGKFWIATYGGGLNQYDPLTGYFTHYLHNEEEESSLGSNDLYTLFYDNRDRLWVGSWNNGLDLMEDEPGKFVHFTHDSDDQSSISNNQVWSITETYDGRIWLGTDEGLCLFNEEERNFYVYKKGLFDPKSLSSNSVKTVFSDHEGRLWAGTYNGGVNLFDKSYVMIRHYYTIPGESSLSFHDVSAFSQFSDSTVLIGTDGGGLNIFNLKSGLFICYTHDPKNPNSIGGNKIKDILKDDKGGAWISFWGRGLDYFDQEKQIFTHYPKVSEQGKGPSSNNISSLAIDNDGMIWLGTFGGGVNKLDPDSRTFEYYEYKRTGSKNVNGAHIWSVLTDKENNIWVGTERGTLNMYDREDNKFIAYNVQEEGEGRFIIQSLFEDTHGNLWLAMEGGGLKYFNTEKRTVKTYTIANGLPSNSISSIEEDTHGNLWISSNNGISSFDYGTGKINTYDLSEGLQGLQFNNSASTTLSTGEMMFGGVNGFNIFHPDSLINSPSRVPIVFTSFQIFNKPVAIGGENTPLHAHINQTQAITLAHDQSVFSIEYAGLNFTDPEKTEYKYRLKGFVDESWQEVDSERKATYTNLNPGTYEFIVTTKGMDTSIKRMRSLMITITPPWWRTWWVRLLIFLCIGGIVLGVYQLRIRNIRQHNKRLEQEVSERTLKLQQANKALHEKNLLIQEQKEEIQTQAEELIESNEEIKSINLSLEKSVEIRTADLRKSNQELDNFVYRVSHDIRAPLSSILGLVDLMEEEKEPNKLKTYLKMTTKSIHRLDGFVRDILDYSRNSRMKVTPQKVDFPELIKDVREELQYMENADGLNIIEEYQLPEVHYNDIRRLQIILRNILSNAIKYQNPQEDNSYLKISIGTDALTAQILVEDNGIGIKAQQHAKVFDMFYRASNLSSGSGIGLYIVKESVEKLGGNIELKSQPDIGTIIKIKLPSIPTEKLEDSQALDL